MPDKTKKLSVDTCTHAIENFLNSVAVLQQDKLEALHEVLFYYIGHDLSKIALKSNQETAAKDLKAICDTGDQTTQSNFLIALTSICYKYAPHDTLSTSCSYASIVSAFHYQALKNPDKPITFTINLSTLAESSMARHAVLLFCLKTFVPEIIIKGNFVNGPMTQQALNELNFIINSLTTKTAFSYAVPDLGQMGPFEMSIFLASVRKATKLVIEDTELNRWTADDFKHFLYEVEQNPQLTSLNLNYTHLNKCCADPSKFKYILQIIGLPQLQKLNLHNNHLSTLPEEQLNILKDALNASPIKKILLTHILREPKGSPGNAGIFATSSTSSTINISSNTVEEQSTFSPS